MRTLPSWLTWIVVLAAGGIFVFVVAGRPSPRGPAAESFAYRTPAEGELPRLWGLPPFDFIDQRVNRVTRDGLRGRPFIANFVFTQCTSACPLLTSRMVQLQRRLGGQDLRFVSFSVDPAHDDIQALSTYARRWNATESRWSLLVTEEKTLREVVAAFRVTAEKTKDAVNPIVHSNVFFLADADSEIRGVYASDDPAALDRLVHDARSLAVGHAVATVTEPPSRYAALGCGGCHENPVLAPPLSDLGGADRLLETGEHVVVDRPYLRRALLEPGRELVKGYPPLMPSYRTELSDAQIELLTDELLARHTGEAHGAANVELFADPVCGMRVRGDPGALRVTHDGHEVFFCSEQCRDAFVASPGKFSLP